MIDNDINTLLKKALPLLLGLLLGCGEEGVSNSIAIDSGSRYLVVPIGSDTPVSGCVVCHSVEQNGPFRVAPTLWGIVGADKARHSWYGYSAALAKADGVWSEQDLDQYLRAPDGFLPGTKKSLIGISDDHERAELIDYLKTLDN